MQFWKSDPLYQQVFAEVRSAWEHLSPEDRPYLVRIEERSVAPSGGAAIDAGRLRLLWLLDGYGVRLANGLRQDPHEFGRPRGSRSEYGLAQFRVARDRLSVDLRLRFHPADSHDIRFDVVRDGDTLRLLAGSGTPA